MIGVKGMRPGVAQHAAQGRRETGSAMREGRYPDRQAAGQVLAEAVAAWLAAHPGPEPVVLALPRGGVPVALPVARALGAPLDLLLVRKIGSPGQPELAAGAVAEGEDGPITVRNAEVIAALGLSEAEFDALRARELATIAERRRLWLSDRPPVPVAGRTAILVDDGLATGATARAGMQALRARGAGRVILAVPVGPPDRLAALESEADAVICPMRPAAFIAVGAHYRNFDQLADAEVRRLLDAAGD